MFNKNPKSVYENTRFAKSFKNMNEPAFKTVKGDKTVNKKPCEGGKLDIDCNS